MATHKRCGWWTLAIALILCATTAPAWANGDHNGDGTIDLLDYDEFPGCMAGPGGGLGNDCDVFDSDSDVDVDIVDFAEFQKVFGTPVAPPDMVLVPAGEFEMGDSFYEGDPNELPVHDVYLDAYYIDTYEVTNQQYADALNWAWDQGGLIHVSSGVVYQYGGTTYPYCDTHSADPDSRIHWDGNTFTVTAGKEDHPMVEVSWYGAVAFCNWRSTMEGRTPCYDLSTWTCDFDVDGFRLPTEVEWEKAAGWDPDLQAHFRFGEHTNGCGYNCLDGQRANYSSSGDPFETGPYPWTTPVGYYDGSDHGGTYQTQDAQSYYGCRDMSGNVWEWCHDWYSETYYSNSPYDNPTGPVSGTFRVLRGGYWYYAPYICRSAIRTGYLPDLRFYYYGFRCVAMAPVAPTGACCQPDGTCSEETDEAACIGLGGVWQGAGTICDPNPCPLPPAVVIDTVTIGNPGNAGELSGEGAGGYGPDRICGAVDYVYSIGKYEVTAAQYTAFLNAVGATDTYGLYNTSMWSNTYGCKIERTGSSGSYTYNVAPDWADRPVNYVSWGDAARFANWLHNGQPSGAQDLTTTEDGSYYLNGATSDAGLLAIDREPDATWVIPSEDEWYKAAYHKNDGVTGNYWDYPMGSSAAPDNGNPGGDSGNSANFYDGDYTIGSPYWRTEGGYFGLSDSPYDTFDQGGNIREWNESVVYEGSGYSYRGLRGGGFYDDDGNHLHASSRISGFPASESDLVGFRVSEAH
jgi:sulfatase modifying factor 1